jgi:ABC-type multidrug transport system fused ATPase/permease subunit
MRRAIRIVCLGERDSLMSLFGSGDTAARFPDFGIRDALAKFSRRLIAGTGDALPSSIYGFILRYSLRAQVYLVVVTLLSFPFLYYSLELPKVIINQAIGGKKFPQEIVGIELGQIPYLVLLCSVFLVLVLINGWFKYHLNVRKGRVGERMLRRLRYDLFQRLLRFPMRHFDRTATGPDDPLAPLMAAE